MLHFSRKFYLMAIYGQFHVFITVTLSLHGFLRSSIRPGIIHCTLWWSTRWSLIFQALSSTLLKFFACDNLHIVPDTCIHRWCGHKWRHLIVLWYLCKTIPRNHYLINYSHFTTSEVLASTQSHCWVNFITGSINPAVVLVYEQSLCCADSKKLNS